MLLWIILFWFIVSIILNLYLIFRSKRYQGEMVVKFEEGGKIIYSLEINENPDGFQQLKELRLKVVTDNSQ